MDEGDVREKITGLEERIEALTQSIQRCRKISMAAKIAIAAGAIWLALLLLWIVSFDATAFVAALTAVLGGIVLLGSNATTWEQTDAALADAEAARTKLIGRIELRLVGDGTPTLH
jgi:hypothetical protein